MTFVDIVFYPAILCVFAAVLLVQKLCRDEDSANSVAKTILLAFSYLTIWLFDWRFCLCITAVILFTYGVGIWIERTEDRRGGYNCLSCSRPGCVSWGI